MRRQERLSPIDDWPRLSESETKARTIREVCLANHRVLTVSHARVSPDFTSGASAIAPPQ